MIQVKVCCISSLEEAHQALQFGANALGLVAEMPSGPGIISESLIAEIAAAVPSTVKTFLLTSYTDPDEIIAQQQRCQVNTIQICDRLNLGSHTRLRSALPEISLVQVVHINDKNSVAEALQTASDVDALLLDSGDQTLPIKELGGTGRTHNWQLSSEIVRKSPVPVFLAGGLNPGNVSNAIQLVNPYGVDLCSGVRTAGKLDEEKLARFMEEVRNVS